MGTITPKRDSRHAAADRRHDGMVDLEQQQQDDGEDGEADPQVAHAFPELLPLVGFFEVRREAQPAEAGRQLL
ncbi:MAG: hypothetical protein ACT4UQ_11580 [Gammaproteobacteria bacterium]